MDRIHEMLKDQELMGRESLLTLSSSARLAVYPDYLQVGWERFGVCCGRCSVWGYSSGPPCRAL